MFVRFPALTFYRLGHAVKGLISSAQPPVCIVHKVTN